MSLFILLTRSWAVKEAAYKALYPTVKSTWKELCYQSLNEAREKPSLVYQPHSSQSNGEIVKLHVSVSHDGDYTAAFVVTEGNLPS
jgi:holo-[acyl-carrier protein] synthase